MIRRVTNRHPKHSERGVTMILVVLAMLSMLGIVALAIDLITLYSARSETQRAADSAALVAAKMLVDAGVTGDPGNAALQATAQTIATTAAKDVAKQSVIAGQAIQAADVTVTFPNSGAASFAINPQVSVTIQNANLPTFFSRIWSRAALTVRATASAEGFNPSNSSSLSGGAGTPVVARCVKPFIIPNCDPIHAGAGCGGTGAPFFDPATGALSNPGAAPGGVIGETFHLVSNCNAGPGCGPLVQNNPTVGIGTWGGPTSYYYPAQLPAATSSCPAACGGGTNFENDISCCNPTPIACGTPALPAVYQLSVDPTVYPEGAGGPAQNGVECLIHQRPGNGMDSLNMPISYPMQISVGNNHPLAGTVLSANDLVTTSDSLVTIPVYDGVAKPAASAVSIIGFLQVFIVQSFSGGGPKAGEFQVTVVNVAGCGSNATLPPVSASSAVPVRLIHQ
jgi:putative Flp pilus-assembly TadE/G-like protein